MSLTAARCLGPYEIISRSVREDGVSVQGAGRAAGPRRSDQVLPERLVGDQEHQARFEQEARAVAAVARAFWRSTRRAGRLFYAVTELLEGDAATEDRTRASSWRRAVEIATSVADGLAAAHAAASSAATQPGTSS
jgi:hypothetical protein